MASGGFINATSPNSLSGSGYYCTKLEWNATTSGSATVINTDLYFGVKGTGYSISGTPSCTYNITVAGSSKGSTSYKFSPVSASSDLKWRYVGSYSYSVPSSTTTAVISANVNLSSAPGTYFGINHTVSGTVQLDTPTEAGGAYIYKDGAFSYYTPYIYKDGAWAQYVPYIWIDGAWIKMG